MLITSTCKQNFEKKKKKTSPKKSVPKVQISQMIKRPDAPFTTEY